MTPNEIKWRRDGQLVHLDWAYALFRTPEGKRVVVNYLRDNASHEQWPPTHRFCIEPPILSGGVVVGTDPAKALWVGESMLALMCAVEALQLTPEPEYVAGDAEDERGEQVRLGVQAAEPTRPSLPRR